MKAVSEPEHFGFQDYAVNHSAVLLLWTSFFLPVKGTFVIILT